MKTHLKRCILWFAIFSFASLWLTSGSLYAQTKCTNQLLADLYNQLKEKQAKENLSGEILIPSLCKSKPVVIKENSQGIINHIGIKLFDRELMDKHPLLIYPFVERYFMELLLMPNNQDAITKMKMERVKISSQVHPMLAVKEGIQKICADFTSNLSFSIICRNNRYFFLCMDKNRELLNMSFPVRYELISGYTKLEAERSFYTDLLTYKEPEYIPVNESELFEYKDSMYCFNEDYYLTEDIISTSYYNKIDNKITPVFSSNQLTESVYNLFNTGYDWGVDAEVTLSMYGGKSQTFDTPLSRLLRLFGQHNCQVYTGIQKYDKSIISGSLMAVNMELGYQHLMMYSFQNNLIDHPKEYKVKIKIYSYIPIHNISSLLDNNSKIK